MLHSSGMHLHCVQLLFSVLPGCVDYMWYTREGESRLCRNYILSTMQPCTAGSVPRMIITTTFSSTMPIQGACHNLLVCSSTLTDCSLSCNNFHWIPTDLHRQTSAKARFLSTWPQPRSNKNHQISLGYAVLWDNPASIHLIQWC